MREGLQTHSDADLISRVHRFLYEHYDAALQGLDPKELTDAQRRALGEAFYHAEKVLTLGDFVAWFRRADDAFQLAAEWRLLIPLHEKLVALVEKKFGDHPNVAGVLNGLAELYRAQGRYEEAEPLYQRGLKIFEKHFGPAHPHVAHSLNGLAELYRAQGRYAEAEPLYQRSLQIREEQLSATHPDVAASLNGLAELYRVQGRHEEAAPLFQRGLKIWEETLDVDHPNVGELLNNWALLDMAHGRFEKAKPRLQRSLTIFEKHFGVAHPITQKIQENYKYLLQKHSGEAE